MENSRWGRHPFGRRQWVAPMISLAALIPAGLATKSANGPGLAGWIHNHLGGLLYVTFFCLLFFPLFPRARIATLAGGVLAATCLLEFLQLWQPPFLTAIRGTTPGAMLLGTTFSPADFPHYLAGAILGGFWVHWLDRLGGDGKRDSTP
ncbi:MAG: DUF2809 domain-containing protein [Desulfococcaceae bacterium]